ncbi:MAG: ferric reductase-like transmembrane domain-containing protein [Spirochaetales bacterium]
MTNRLKSSVLIILAILGLAYPVYAWWQNAYLAELLWPDTMYEIARVLSLLGFVMMFYQFALSSRSKLLESSLGLDRLISLHRSSGIWTLGLLLLHGVALFTYDLVLGSLSLSFGKALGVFALLLLIVVSAAAIFWKSFRWRYETWKRIHYATYVILPLGFVHALLLGTTVSFSPGLRTYFIALSALYVAIVLTRVVKRIAVRRNPHVVAEVVQENHDITSLYFDGPEITYAPGQFMTVNIQAGRGYSESHPYTISSSPTDGRLRISAKAIGDFSKNVASVRPGTKALIEAPYGVFSYTSVQVDELVFIVGGIGITPFLSQLKHMRATGAKKQVTMIWGNKTKKDICFTEELAAAEAELPEFKLVHVLSDEKWEGETGFVTADLIRKYVSNVEKPHFFLCGPPVMMEKVFGALSNLGVSNKQMHYERFALG